MTTPEKPLCGAVPDLPPLIQFHPCTRPAHSPATKHRVEQDGLVIEWDTWSIDAFRILLGLDR